MYQELSDRYVLTNLTPSMPKTFTGLPALSKWLDNRMEKYISSDTLCDLVEVVVKNNIF